MILYNYDYERNNLLCGICKIKYGAWLTTKLKDKTILFANTAKQLELVNFPCVHTKIKNSSEILNSFIEDDFKTLGAIGTLNEGVTIPNLKNAIVLHSFSNPTKFKQRLGRLLRLNPDDHAHIHVLCYKNTKDEEWVRNALKEYKDSKIKYYDLNIKL